MDDIRIEGVDFEGLLKELDANTQKKVMENTGIESPLIDIAMQAGLRPTDLVDILGNTIKIVKGVEKPPKRTFSAIMVGNAFKVAAKKMSLDKSCTAIIKTFIETFVTFALECGYTVEQSIKSIELLAGIL